MELEDNLEPNESVEVVESEPQEAAPEPASPPEDKTANESVGDTLRRLAGEREEQQKKEELKQRRDEEKRLRRLGAPPPAWSKNVADKWTTLDEEIRLEIAKREEEVTRGFSKDSEDKKLAKEFKEVFEPYEKQGINFPRGYKETVRELLGAANVLYRGDAATKLAYLEKTAQSVGIDLRQAYGYQNNIQQEPKSAQQVNNEFTNPEISALNQQIQHLGQSFSQFKQFQEQLESKEAQKMLQDFASNPKNKYYQQAAPIMGQLIDKGMAESLEDAYEKAILFDPNLRSMRNEDLQKEAIAKYQDELKNKTQAAKKAAVSITGSPPVRAEKDIANLSIGDLLRKNAREMGFLN